MKHSTLYQTSSQGNANIFNGGYSDDLRQKEVLPPIPMWYQALKKAFKNLKAYTRS